MNGRESELTYRDVATVLALLDGWGRGRIHFRNGGFEVDAFVAETSGTPASARTLNISSPCVGPFRAALVGTVAGETIGEGTIIGHVVALGRSTPVTSEAAGRLARCWSGTANSSSTVSRWQSLRHDHVCGLHRRRRGVH